MSDCEAAAHPVLTCAQTVSEAVKQAAGSSPVFMSPRQKREALVELHRAEAALAGLKLSVLAASDDLAEADGNRHMATWLGPAVRRDPRPMHAEERLAKALDARWQLVASGMLEGSVNLDQAKVIVRALDRLTEPLPPDPERPELGPEPRHIPAAVLAEAEAALVDAAARHTPQELAAIGDRILHIVAWELADDEERKRLEREEKRAAAVTRLAFRHRGDGTTDVSARIPDAIAARLKTYLHAFTSPRHDDATRGDAASPYLDPETGRRLPEDRVLGLAFCAFLEAADPDRMPVHGGDATKVVVTIDLESLQQQTGIATLGDGSRITVSEARRYACTAGIIPAVLGSESEVLDLGREARLFSSAQRIALGIGHPHCRAEHCTVPATWCEAHHEEPWAAGGTTDLDKGVLLCSWHHHRAHDDRYLHSRLPNGDVRFTRRR